MSGNETQIEYWNGKVGERWAAFQETLDRAMSAITASVLAFAAAKPGEHVLDIGCGCGTTALLLAKAVAPGGKVSGVDISAPMLARARARAKAADADIAFAEADASERAFEPEFDLVFSRFGAMFFADPAAAFANTRKALKPGGRMAFVCWRAAEKNAWASAPFAAARDLLPPQEPADPQAPGPFAFADGGRVKGILREAGFSNVRLEELDTAMDMGADLEAAIEQSLKIGPLARALSEADEAVKDKVRARIRDALATYLTPKGVLAPAACWLVSGDSDSG